VPSLRTKLEETFRAVNWEKTPAFQLADDVLKLLCAELTANPTLIEEICENTRLERRKVRGSDIIQKANEVRRQRRLARIAEAAKVIQTALADVPTLSYSRLAQRLNLEGVEPHRRDHWNDRAVARIIKEAGIVRQSTPA
jgi:hypothetical protein